MIEMKDSGIEWIGEIPAHWEIRRLKDVSSFVNGYAFDSNDFETDDGIKVIRIGDIGQSVDFENCARAKTDSALLSGYKINDGDILLAMSGATTGKTCIVYNPQEAFINQRVGIIRSKMSKMIFYLLQTPYFLEFVNLYNTGSAQPNISSKDVGEFPIIVVPAEERQMLTDYLDKKTAEIDEQITALEKKSDAYQRLKRSLISEVVTRGLNPTAKLKDSGIEWIGEIPEHWVIKRFKEMFRHYSTGFTPDSKDMNYFADDEINTWVTIADLADKYIVDSNMYLSDKAINDYAPILSPKGSLLFSFKLSVGKTAFAGKNLYTNEAIVTIPPQRNNDLRYFYYLIPEACANNATENIYGAKMLNQKIIANMILLVPPIDEQRAISDYLDKKTVEIDSNISAISSKIDALKRLKQSLIDEVVTGKRRIEKA